MQNYRDLGAIHLQASSEAEADSTGLRPVNWPAFCAGVKQADKLARGRFGGQFRSRLPEADWEASSEAD